MIVVTGATGQLGRLVIASYIQSHRFTIFAWSRIVLGGASLAMVNPGIVH
jgi:uncharacterized protein YbjT (DUF2867 family)